MRHSKSCWTHRFATNPMKRAFLFHSLLLLLAFALGLPLVVFAAFMAAGGTQLWTLAVGIWTVCALPVFALALFWYDRQIRRPLDTLTTAIDHAARGQTTAHVTLRGASELAELTAHFNAMLDAREAYDRALRETKEKYQLLVEQVPAVIYRSTVERHKSALFVNPEIGDLLGYSPQEWLANGALWYECLHPDDRTRVMDALKHLRASDGALQLEYRMYARDGRLLWVRDNVRALSRPNGKPPLLQGALFDMTMHKLADEKLAYYARLVEQAPDAIIATDSQRRITAWNRAAAEMYGVPASRVLGESLDRILPDAAERAPRGPVHALERARATHFRQSGEPFPVEITITPLRDANAQIMGYVRVHRDLNAPRAATETSDSNTALDGVRVRAPAVSIA